MKRYAIVIEDAGTNLAAYVPDLPGCVATGESEQEVERLIREVIALHLEGMAEDGFADPPSRRAAWITSRSMPDLAPIRGVDPSKPCRLGRGPAF